MQTTLFPIAGPPARRFDDERPALKDALVEFFVHSKGSSRILGLLSTKRRSIGYKALMEEIRFNEKPDDHKRPPSAIRAVLRLIQAAGLVNLTRHGFSLTEVGREGRQTAYFHNRIVTTSSRASRTQTTRSRFVLLLETFDQLQGA